MNHNPVKCPIGNIYNYRQSFAGMLYKYTVMMTVRDTVVGVTVDFAELGDVHIPAAILKSFLRQLPEPILTYDLYDHIVHVQCRCSKMLQGLCMNIKIFLNNFVQREQNLP